MYVRHEDNTKTNVIQIQCDAVNWLAPAQGWGQCQALVSSSVTQQMNDYWLLKTDRAPETSYY
jgi:hypothetical protein